MGIWGKFQAYFTFFTLRPNRANLIQKKKNWRTSATLEKKGKEIKRVRRLYPFNFPKKSA